MNSCTTTQTRFLHGLQAACISGSSVQNNWWIYLKITMFYPTTQNPLVDTATTVFHTEAVHTTLSAKHTACNFSYCQTTQPIVRLIVPAEENFQHDWKALGTGVDTQNSANKLPANKLNKRWKTAWHWNTHVNVNHTESYLTKWQLSYQIVYDNEAINDD